MNYDYLAATEGRPLNFGPVVHASAHAQLTGPCGDTLQIWLKIEENIICKASFVSDGCEDSVICCSTAARMAEGMRLEDAVALSQENILAKAPPIRNDHRHCALLAVNTLEKRSRIIDQRGIPRPKTTVFRARKRKKINL